jgi:hypothetical protein
MNDQMEGQMLHAFLAMVKSHRTVCEFGTDQQIEKSQANVDRLESSLRDLYGDDVIDAIKKGAVN